MRHPAKRIRVWFYKRGDARFLSHHDVMRLFERALRRSGLPVCFTQGFNPRPRMAFPLALGVGLSGEAEVAEVTFQDDLDPEDMRARLAAECLEGIGVLQAEALPEGEKGRAEEAVYRVETSCTEGELARLVAGFLKEDSVYTTRHILARSKRVDVRSFVQSLSILGDGSLEIRARVTPLGTVRPLEVIDAMGLPRTKLRSPLVVLRSQVNLASSSRSARETHEQAHADQRGRSGGEPDCSP